MDYFPMFLDLKGRPCLVAGGGTVARRKVALLLRAGARVTVVAPILDEGFQAWLAEGTIDWRPGPFEPGDAGGQSVIVAATSDRAVNRAVAEAARQRSIPVNVVDDPELSTFIVPAIVDRSPVTIAISSGGRSPTLARLLRARLETLIPFAYGRLARLAHDLRAAVAGSLADARTRRGYWERILLGPVAELVFAGQEGRARSEALRELERTSAETGVLGDVVLVGAGPGDPELLTLGGLRALQSADVVVHDRLVSAEVLDLARRDAERIDVGKAPGGHARAQAEINALLVRLAREGRRVVRLKGGDPLLFGRGGEEMEALRAAGIPYRVIAGVTAAAGCAAAVGIPLTHREHAHGVILGTGHGAGGENPPGGWAGERGVTRVYYMGVAALDRICARLAAEGLSPNTPAALIQEGTTPRQRVVAGTLATLPAQAALHQMRSPALLVIGEVVRFTTAESIEPAPRISETNSRESVSSRAASAFLPGAGAD
jgi:uroporphyrin-III C-methyltransferase/precorrin-2 dehydrogenase/sirohydrochlorin ferrochelatase